MRKINGKLFLGLLIGGVVLTAALFVVHYFQYQRIARALLWQARHAEEEGQTERMAQYLKRYLEFNPRDYAEKANLAKAWTGDAFAANPRLRSQAVRLLDEVLTWNDDPDLRRLLVKTALDLGDVKMARDHLVHLLDEKNLEKALRLDPEKENPDPAQGELEGYWGLILEADKRTPQALRSYRLAIRHAPEVQTSYVRLAYLLRRSNETDPTQRKKLFTEADQTIDRLVNANKEKAESYLARWRYRRDFDLLAIRETGPRGAGQPGLEDAAQDIADALVRKATSVEVLLAAADLERLRGRVASEDPKRTNLQRRAGLKEHRDKAFDYLSRGLDVVRRNRASGGVNGEFQLLWHKGNLLLDDLEFKRAQAEEDSLPAPDTESTKEEIRALVELVRKSQVPALADYMKGRLLAHEREWAEAASLFERARALMASHPDLACQADLYLGQCYERLEEHTQMYNAFKRVADWDPASLPAQLGMAAARWAQGKLIDAEQQYAVVIKQGRLPPRAWIDIARLEIQRQSQAAKADWTTAETALANAEKALEMAAPGNHKAPMEVILLRAEILVRQEKLAAARDLLEKEKTRTPKEVDLWTALADLALRDKDKKAGKTLARSIIDQARDQLGDKVSLRLAEARFYLVTKQATAKLQALAENRDRFSEEDQARLLSGIADAYLRAGNSDEARKLWQALAAMPKHKHDLRLRLLLFDLAMQQNSETEMQKMLADIRSVEQANGSYQRYGLALLLIWQARQAPAASQERAAKLRQARRELDRVLSQRPSWPPVFVARAEISDLKGEKSQVIADLQEAVRNGERSPTILIRLVGFLTDAGRDAEARAVLADAQQAAKSFPDLQRIEAVLAYRAGDMDKAYKIALTELREKSKNPRDLLWRAQILAKANKPDEAMTKFKLAMENAGADHTPVVVTVQFLVSQDHKDEALKLIASAKDQLPKDKASLALGLCYDAVGQPKEALACYKKAIDAKPDDLETIREVTLAHLAAGRAAEATPLLRRMVTANLKGGTAADVAWAKRSLAMILATGTDYKRFTEALGLVGLQLDGDGRLKREDSRDDSVENRRAKARVLASQQGQRQFRQKAIELLEDLGRASQLNPDDRFILALLLDAEGRTREAWRNLGELVQKQTRTPAYLAQYAMSLIVQRKDDKDLQKAEELIQLLEEMEKTRKVEPNTYASVELRGRVLEARNKGDEAVDLLEQLAFRKTAKPEEVLLVLASMGRQKLHKKAFALCEKTWNQGKCPPEVIGAATVALVHEADLSDAQLALVEKHLLDAVARKPDSAALKMHLATLYDKRGEYERAADQYRAVLKLESKNVVALNNLAWLLATKSVRSEDQRKALDYINEAVNGLGRRADLLDTRGMVHLALNDRSAALEDLKEATQEAPTPARLFHLALAYHKDRNGAKASETLKAARKKGLKVDQLHPAERADCQLLLREYPAQ